MARYPIIPNLMRVVPACFLVGAGIEFFMVNTGFYDIVTRLEAERLEERRQERVQRKEEMSAFRAGAGGIGETKGAS